MLPYQLAGNPHQFINSAKIWISYAWHDFHYGSFKQVSTDFSGKKLPGAAPQVVVAGLDVASKTGCYMNITYNYTDRIALNDANSAYASSYNLMSTRLGYRKDFHQKSKRNFCRSDNLVRYKIQPRQRYQCRCRSLLQYRCRKKLYAGVFCYNGFMHRRDN
jgi:iron complex outermembrane receptor protein